MSSKNKLIEKLRSRSNSFTYAEAKSLLGKLGYEEKNKGKTSGSRVAFVHMETQRIICLHKPHPGNTLKMYAIDELIVALEGFGEI